MLNARGICFAVVAMLLAVSSGQSAAEEPGRQLYLQYCSACHGESGRGDGVVSQLMRPRPSDLTGIARRAGGEFPYVEVVEAIDGRRTLRAHGDPDMPVWGEIFRAEAGSALSEQAMVRGKVMLITDYLLSVQEK